MKFRWAFHIVLLCGVVLMVMALGEAVVRAVGHTPQRFRPQTMKMSVVPDVVLGWRNAPGMYTVPGVGSGVVRATIAEGGNRVTHRGSGQGVGGPDIWILGDSLTAGWGVTDEETYAWKLQEQFPKMTFSNYGVPGYGTVQSLLHLRQLLQSVEEKPWLILYGFNDFFPDRNVAGPPWRKAMDISSRIARRLPYAFLDAKGVLQLHAPIGFGIVPLRRILASAALLEEELQEAIVRQRVQEKTIITERLLGEMSRESGNVGAQFIVVFLSVGQEAHEQYGHALEQQGIPFIDCAFPEVHVPEMQVPGDGHPNGRMHTLFSECIAPHIQVSHLRSDGGG